MGLKLKKNWLAVVLVSVLSFTLSTTVEAARQGQASGARVAKSTPKGKTKVAARKPARSV